MWAERLVLPGLMGLSLVTFHTDAPLFFSRNKCLLGNQHWFLDAGWTSAAPVHRSALISEHSQVGSKYSLSFVTVITYSKDISSNKGGLPWQGGWNQLMSHCVVYSLWPWQMFSAEYYSVSHFLHSNLCFYPWLPYVWSLYHFLFNKKISHHKQIISLPSGLCP